MEVVMKLVTLFFRTALIITLLAVPPLTAAGGAGTRTLTLRAPTPTETGTIIDAVVAGSVEPLQAAVAAGIDVARATTYRGIPALIFANNVAVAQFLIDHGASVTAVDDLRNTPLHEAARGGHLACAKLLITHGASVTAVGWAEETPLHRAAVGGHLACTKLLIDHGASATAVDCGGNTPLHAAANSNIIDKLIEAGAVLDACNARGFTPLMEAAFRGNITIVKQLLAADANPLVVSTDGNTMSTLLARRGMTPDQISALLAEAAWQRRKHAVVVWHHRWITPLSTENPAAGGAGAPAAASTEVPSEPVD